MKWTISSVINSNFKKEGLLELKKTTKFGLVGFTGAAVLAWNTLGVNFMVNKEVAPTKAYFSSEEIPSGTVITKDMLNYIEVPASALPPNAITNEDDIVGKYVKYGYSIPMNSYFFNDVVLAEDNMPNSSVLKLGENEYAYPLIVDLETSLGNGIVPDTYVDLAFRTTVYNPLTEKDEPVFGVLAKNIRVTSVKDNNAVAVFNEDGKGSTKNQSQSLTKLFTFAVSPELNELLNKAILLGEVRPIAKGEVADEQSDLALSTNEVVTWIENNSFDINSNDSQKVAANQ